MQHKDEIINNFLEFLSQIARENPQYDFKSNEINSFVYHYLVRLGVNKSDLRTDLRDKESPNFNGNILNNSFGNPKSSFSRWINNFRNRSTDVFVQENWKYFCQFISRDREAKKSANHLKVYIPLDSEHIDYGADEIFNFLENNNISHVSKIGKEIRFDDIVIRLINSSDLDKLLNFVNNNKYIQQGLIEPNPFAYSKDGIAMAVDGQLSYNSTVCGLLCLYINNKKQKNELKNVSAQDFYDFVYESIRKEFVSSESTELTNYFGIYGDETKKNYKEVFLLILKAHDPNFNYDRFKEHYQNCTNNKQLSQNQIDKTDRMLLEAIDVMIRRFNNVQAILNVEAYYLTGRQDRLTRNNNLRDRIVNSTFREDLHKILLQERMNFIQYANKVMAKYEYDPNQVLNTMRTSAIH